MLRRALPLTLALVAAGLAAAACAQDPHILPKAPEPAAAPPASNPDGVVIPLGAPDPEGVVVDASSRFAVVATRSPARLVRINLTGFTVQDTIPVPGAARHIELAGPEQVIVPGENTDTLSVVSIPSGTVESVAHVGRQPHDAQQLAGGVIVDADEIGGTVTATLGDRVVGSISGLIQPGGVARAAGLAAVVDVRGRLLDVFAAQPLRFLGSVPAGAGPTHAVGLGDDRVAVADTDGGRLIIVRVSSKPAVVATLPLPNAPYGMAVDLPRHRLWVATSGDNVLHEFDLGAGAPVPGKTYRTVQQANSLAVVPSTGQVVLAGALPQGVVQELTP